MKQPKVYQNNVKLTLGQIESLELVGIHRNNWQGRTIKLYADPESTEHVYSVGKPDSSEDIILDHNKLAETMNFRIALDYWKHGQKVYTRD